MKHLSIVLLAAASLFSGCVNDPRLGSGTLYLADNGSVVCLPDRGRANFDNISYWDGDSVGGAPSILIRLGEQTAYFYKGGHLVGVSSLSTGREGYNTPTGNFTIIRKNKNHVSSCYGDYVDAKTGEILQRNIDRRQDPMPKGAKYDGAKMNFYMEIKPGYGMHEGFLPGVPASHGCIRMPSFMAEAFFHSAPVGTPVRVVQQ